MLWRLFRRASLANHDKVAVCIPAWRAEDFIARTLDCALGQTHANLQIIVSVDRCEDATAAICKAFADKDARIEVHEQKERLGWAANVNFLLDQVRSPFFFLYFHDDIINPKYTELLLHALKNHAEAMSAHCDMGHFGASERVSKGRAYVGSAAQRLATFLVVPARGSPLRSLTRATAIARGLRMPTDAIGGFWANEPYLMRSLASGPALHVPQVLYLRWDERAEGLTDSWKKLSPDEVLTGLRANFATSLAIIDEVAKGTKEREALVFCLSLQTLTRMRDIEAKNGSKLSAEALHPAFFIDTIPEGLAEFGPDVEKWAWQRHKRLMRNRDEVAGPRRTSEIQEGT
jgi:hypothetical protein